MAGDPASYCGLLVSLAQLAGQQPAVVFSEEMPALSLEADIEALQNDDPASMSTTFENQQIQTD